MEQTEKAEKSHKARYFLIILFFILVIYCGGIIAFSYVLFPQTIVNGVKAGLRTEKELYSYITLDESNEFTVFFQNGEVLELPLTTIKDTTVGTSKAKTLIEEQNEFFWPYEVFQKKEINTPISFDCDKAKVKNVLTDYVKGIEEIPPQNAYIYLDKDNNFQIMPEEIGTMINVEKTADNIVAKLQNGQLKLGANEVIYVQPEITQNDQQLLSEFETLTGITERTITIDLKGVSETIHVGDFLDTKALMNQNEVFFQEEKIDEYLHGLEDKYNTYETQREFVTSKKETIMVGGNGGDTDDTYGFIMDFDATKEVFIQALYDETTDKCTVVWYKEGDEHGEKSDIGDTYIEISLEDQTLWYYKEGKLVVETPVVTGMPTPSRSTPTGVFEVFSKSTDIRLQGTMDGESWDNFVDFWLAITWTEVGIHNSPWRDSYGGDIYTYNGSHGCINVPYDAEKTLYENADIGTCVVIY